MRFLKYILVILVLKSHLCSCSLEQPKPPFGEVDNTIELLKDGDISTWYISSDGGIKLDFAVSSAVTEVLLTSSGIAPNSDPVSVKILKSLDGKVWENVCEFKDKELRFSARFHQARLEMPMAVEAAQLRVEIESAPGESLSLSEVGIEAALIDVSWNDFPTPIVNFKDVNVETQGSRYYNTLVQNPTEYIAYHAKIVAKQLYYSSSNLKASTTLSTINYTLKDYDGVSGKSGHPPIINIDYSTRHVERSYGVSMYRLDYETRGVLYHELTHGYQICDPKGIPTYNQGNTAWAAIEGLADAVRISLGYTQMSERKAGGGYMDGYKTTGFFIHWLTSKDTNAIRRFNASFSELDKWSFDGAMQYIFDSKEFKIDTLWSEYQTFIKNN